MITKEVEKLKNGGMVIMKNIKKLGCLLFVGMILSFGLTTNVRAAEIESEEVQVVESKDPLLNLNGEIESDALKVMGLGENIDSRGATTIRYEIKAYKATMTHPGYLYIPRLRAIEETFEFTFSPVGIGGGWGRTYAVNWYLAQYKGAKLRIDSGELIGRDPNGRVVSRKNISGRIIDCNRHVRVYN